METLLFVVISFVGYIVAYHTYGRFLARKVFRLDDRNPVPSKELEDGIDYVPTRKGIIFGHHYTSIAGTGPIVGPAIGIIWGWLPALIWVFVGSIVMGAVHDFASLVMSMRNEGKSIAEVAARYVSSRARTIFFFIAFLELLIVIAIFGVVISAIFALYPESVVPIWFEIPIAIALGLAVYRWKRNVMVATAVGVFAMYATVVAGHWLPFSMPDVSLGQLTIPHTGVWVIVLLIYAFFASAIPVTVLLQPRDYLNAWQLFIAMGLLIAGIVGAASTGRLEIVAPAVNLSPAGAPPMWPFLFVTIACGAISGFHCLVASGTTPKQVRTEGDALFVGYGSMLMESALAVLVIAAVAAGIGMAYQTKSGEILSGTAAWNEHYQSWTAAKGLGSKLAAVVVGAANMIETVGIPKAFGIVIMGVFIASFAGTTLDTATRIQRYVISELAADFKIRPLTNRWVAAGVAVVSAGALAFATGADGKGALTLWPMFGAVNQLLAALALLIATVYLKRRSSWTYLLTLAPCLFMIAITIWAIVLNEISFINASPRKWILIVINALILILSLGLIVEAFVVFFRPPQQPPRQTDAG